MKVVSFKKETEEEKSLRKKAIDIVNSSSNFLVIHKEDNKNAHVSWVVHGLNCLDVAAMGSIISYHGANSCVDDVEDD